jgi:hypothetical protein
VVKGDVAIHGSVSLLGNCKLFLYGKATFHGEVTLSEKCWLVVKGKANFKDDCAVMAHSLFCTMYDESYNDHGLTLRQKSKVLHAVCADGRPRQISWDSTSRYEGIYFRRRPTGLMVSTKMKHVFW